MALGAAGILMAPPSGDGLLLAIGEVRQRRAEEEERARLHSEILALKRRAELIERIARLADEGDRTKAAIAIAEALAEASRASGVAIYVAEGDAPPHRTRLAAVGSARLLDDDGMGRSLEGTRLLTLALGGRTVGYALLDNASGLEGDAYRPLLEMASAVLAAGQPRSSGASSLIDTRGSAAWSRVYSLEQFRDTASREIDRARRHGRRLVLGAILAAETRGTVTEQTLLDAIRESDVLARGAFGEYFLLLPETGALGAHAFRRRVLRLASPASRRLEAGTPDRPPAEQTPKLAIGVAAYPHDGQEFESLVTRARARAEEAVNSIVHRHSWGAKPLAEVIDALLAAPTKSSGSGPVQLARIDLPAVVLAMLASTACSEALRGGGATVVLAFHRESGTVRAVRTATQGKDATVHAVDASRFDHCENAEAMVVLAEHGTWTLCARFEGMHARAVHSADPLLADVVAQKLAKASGVRLG
jgi:hypothetical protein